MSKKNMILYLASPYSVGDANQTEKQRRHDASLAVTAKALNAGYIVYNPIISCRPLELGAGLPDTHEFWIASNEAFIGLCDEVWVFDFEGLWKQSRGVGHEIDYARRTGKRVVLIDENLTRLSILVRARSKGN